MNTDLSSYTFGKIPPQAKELEEAVISACSLEKDSVLVAVSILKPEHFYVTAHQLIFSAIVRLFSRNEAVDILTIVEDLKKHGSLEEAGGQFFVSDVCLKSALGWNVEHHARIVKQKWIQRERIRISSEQIKDAYEDTSDALEGLGNSVTQYADLLNEVSAGAAKSFQDVVDSTFKGIAHAASKSDDEKYIIGLTTGNYLLDRKCLGFNAPNFVLIAGRNSDGKTSLALAGLLLNAKRNVPVGLFSLEMSTEEVIQKLTALETDIEVERIRSGRVDKSEWQLLDNAQDLLRELPIKICDKGGIELAELSAIAKGWKAKFGVKLFFVDYLQLMELQDKKLNQEQKVSKISRGLKSLAKELASPVVAISALSRNLETRSGWDKRPRDSDLREGGSLEYDADMIIFVFRPENHGLENFGQDDGGGITQNIIELIVSKNKLGSRGIIRQSINNGTSKFSDIGTIEYKAKINIYESATDTTPF